jgi:hypothetical protein
MPMEVAIDPEPSTEPKTQTLYKKEGSLAAAYSELDLDKVRAALDTEVKGAFQNDATLFDKLLKEELTKLEVKPVKPEDAMSHATLAQLIQKISTAHTEDDIEKMVRSIQSGADLMNEFGESLADSCRECKKAYIQIVNNQASVQRREKELSRNK